MNTLQIDKCLKQNKHTKKIYRGTFAIDQVPLKEIKKPTLFVINLDTSDQNGSHWISIYLTKSIFELFDSGGRLLNQHIYFNYIRKCYNKKKFVYNKTQIQDNSSICCGYFCCMFALAKAKKITTKYFISIFNKKNLIDNDLKISYLFDKYFSCSKKYKFNIKCNQKCIELKKKVFV
jgi:hypothetical protein